MLMTNSPSIIWTDHKPLTFFLETPLFYGIYSRWALELGALNVEIRYIEGSKNKVADALSQTIFPDPECAKDDFLDSIGDVVDNQDGKPKWVWKDGKGRYEELLQLRKIQENDAKNLESKQVELTTNLQHQDNFEEQLEALAAQMEEKEKYSKYQDSGWYQDIWIALLRASYPPDFDRVQVDRLK